MTRRDANEEPLPDFPARDRVCQCGDCRCQVCKTDRVSPFRFDLGAGFAHYCPLCMSRVAGEPEPGPVVELIAEGRLF